MFQKAKKAVGIAAEAVGVVTPSVADAQSAAEIRRQELVSAQAAITKAEETLQALFDDGAESTKITAAEAILADSRLTAERAQRAYTSAEKRLAVARSTEQTAKQKAARLKFNDALAVRLDAAGAIDRLAIEVGKLVDIITDQDRVLAESMRDGVAARECGYVLQHGQLAAHLALSKAGAVPRIWRGDIAEHPGAVALIAKDNGALAAQS